MPSKNPNNHEYRIVGKGAGLKYKTPPLSVRFPPDILETLKSRTDTQDFVRAAVVEKLERDAALPCSQKEAIDPAPSSPEPAPKKKRGRPPKAQP